MRPGPPTPTIRDVAERAGVSKSLVSLVLRGSAQVREEKRQAVLAAVDELLDPAGLTQPYLGVTEEHRLRVIADRVQSWWPDGSLNSWRQSLESRLAAAGRRR